MEHSPNKGPVSDSKNNTCTDLNFENSVSESIECILSVLGAASKQKVYSFLENQCGLKKDEIPLRPAEFDEAIEKIFGKASKMLELKIIERICLKYPNFIFPKDREIKLADLVSRLRSYLTSEQCLK